MEGFARQQALAQGGDVDSSVAREAGRVDDSVSPDSNDNNPESGDVSNDRKKFDIAGARSNSIVGGDTNGAGGQGNFGAASSLPGGGISRAPTLKLSAHELASQLQAESSPSPRPSTTPRSSSTR